jgi:hypothetical protein
VVISAQRLNPASTVPTGMASASMPASIQRIHRTHGMRLNIPMAPTKDGRKCTIENRPSTPPKNANVSS